MTPNSTHPPTAEQVALWSPADRAEVSRALAIIASSEAPPPPRRRRRLVLSITAFAALVLIPWIFYLSVTLRERHRVIMWNTAWVGFDVLLALSFALGAWAMWKRRLIAIPFLTASAVLLLVDSWFDVTMSWGTREQRISLLTALLLEIPLAIVLMLTVRMSLLRLSDMIGRLRGDPPTTRSVLARTMPAPGSASIASEGTTPVAKDQAPLR